MAPGSRKILSIRLCGRIRDVFWQENKPEKDPYATDLSKLEESRKLVLERADFIVPGHADIYEIKKD